jgi:ribosomal protein S18 acetylase RimI-like enzyme
MTEDNLPYLSIRVMEEADLTFAAECTAAEGWVSENQTTLEGFFIHEPKGCLIAEAKERPVGICFASFYGKSGFIGELIVRPEARGKGVGAALLNQGLKVLKDRGVETVYLDGVVKAVELYERNGFRKVCRSSRFSGHMAGKPSTPVRQMVISDLEQVFRLDGSSFGADRSFFLRRRLELFPELSYVMMDHERVTGFILGRCGEGWVSAGPWVISEDAENPVELLDSFALQAGDRPISIGILETNHQACHLIRSLGFVERVESPWRMAHGRSADLGASPSCFAVGSAAKG